MEDKKIEVSQSSSMSGVFNAKQAVAEAIAKFKHEMADRSPGDRRSFAARAEGFLTHALSIGHYEDPWYIAAITGERAPEPLTLRRPRIATV